MDKQDDRNEALLDRPPGNGQTDPAGLDDGREMDAATRSVSNALRTSFLALKLVLLSIVGVYLIGGGYFTVPPGSQAVVVQFGRIKGLDSQAGPILQPGPHWMWPWPISDRIVQDIEKSRTLSLSDFWFYVDPRLRGLSIDDMLKKASPPGVLTPGVDGYLLTGEQEIVHLQLVIKYRVDNLLDFVSHLRSEPDSPDRRSTDEGLIRRIAYWACTRTVASMPTDAVVRGEVDTFKETVKRLMEKQLSDPEFGLKTGLSVVDVIVEARTVPLQVRPNYLAVVQAENERLKLVSGARTQATTVLNEMAGPAHEPLKQAIQAYELARAKGQTAAAEADMRQILSLVDHAGGMVAGTIGAAMAERSRLELAVRAEVRRFRDLYDKYQANPSIFIAQLWEDVKADIMNSPELEVIYLPFASKEIRMTLDRNPQFLKAREARKYQQQVGG